MQTEINIKIDDSILLSLKEEKETLVKDMLFSYAVKLYRDHKLSLGKAAELAGYDRLDFIQLLKLNKEPVFDYEAGMIDEMVEKAKGIVKGKKDKKK